MNYNFKFIIGFFVLLYTIVTFLFFNFYKELAIKDTRQEAMSILSTMKAISTYLDEIQEPVMNDLKNLYNQKNFFDARAHSLSFITQYIYDKQMSENNARYKYKLVATNPLDASHKANKFEADLLNKFREGKIKDYFTLIEENNKSYFFIAMPINKNKKSCLQCHGDPKDAPANLVETYGTKSGFYEKVGDIRAMIYLKIAVSSIIGYHKEEFITGGLAMFIVFIVFIILIYLMYKKDMRLKEKKENLFMHQNRLAIMGGMIGNISHQWKQPLSQLSYILINLELLSERNKLTNEKLLNKVEAANVQISFMSDSINDFKNFFSPNKIMGEHNIEDILQQSRRLLQASLDEYNIKLTIDKEDGFLLYGSYNEFVQVFINIINNAKDSFISNEIKDCYIHVKAYKENDKNIITIENNAGTIDENVIDKIFEPYFSTKDLKVSTGIGLYICKLIIENNNGTIDVKNFKKGVVFTIKF